MAKFAYKTRGQSNPQGKQRVYFTAHPADYEPFFEKIVHDILKKQDCVVYYDEEPQATYEEEELLTALSQMQLVVIPITSYFLYEKNRALEVEFYYAMNHHIPVLPLIQELELEKEFNAVCGDLQWLDANACDVTAISYEEKLEKFLEAVLVGDKLAERVRNAFDAYIFLSYRKKDRKYAQELMKLIHKNDFCQDIAIWYDELLTPGKDFNEGIEVALDKSGLFALAVTPNILDEDNYIMTTEYPLAKEKNKAILPAELVPTNQEELKNKYKDIPDSTDAYDEFALSAALLREVRRMAIKGNDVNPEHKFLIGMAYLSGIDVEVDYDRAVKLITESAEKGYEEAMSMLVEMYTEGRGVARSNAKVIEWQEKLVAQQEARYQKEPTKENAYSLFVKRRCLAEFYGAIREFDFAKETNAKNLALVDALGEEDDELEWGIQTSLTYLQMGSNCLDNEDYANAEKYLEKCSKLALKLIRKWESIRATQIYLLVAFHRGDIAMELGDYTIAAIHYKMYVNVWKELIEKFGQDGRKALAVSYTKLGEAYEQDGKYEAAVECHEESLRNREALVKSGEMSADFLTVAYEHIACLLMRGGMHEEALHYLQKSLAIRNDEWKKSSLLSAKIGMIDCHMYLAELYSAMEQWKEAKWEYLSVIRELKYVLKFYNSSKVKRKLADAHMKLGQIYKNENNAEYAIEHFRESLAINQGLEEKRKLSDNISEIKKK